MIPVKYGTIRSLVVWYLIIPYFIFLAAWVRWMISIPCVLFLGFSMYRISKEKTAYFDTLKLPAVSLGIIIVVSVLWCQSAGIGGLFYQSPDHQFRNAVFRDLLSHKWPVTYETYGTGLVYYLGIWIVPAAFGKVFLKWNFPNETAWNMAEIMLLLWCGIGIILLVLLLCLYFRQCTVAGIILILFLLIGFSGLDIVGELWKNGLKIHDHIEWWSGYFQFRSNTTALFWAYNQAIPCWLMTMLLLSEMNLRSYCIIICCTLFYSPFSVAGISLCVLVLAYSMAKNEEGNLKGLLKDVCSFQNIAAAVTILPVLAVYYSCNAGGKSKIRFCFEDYGGLSGEMAKIWLVFLILELGVYVCFLIRKEYKNPLLYGVLASLLINSVVSLGETGEVVYRISATMPGLFLLMCFVMKVIFRNPVYPSKRHQFLRTILILVFLLGTFTPAIEYCRALSAMKEQKAVCIVADDLKTLNQENAPINFIGYDIRDSLFYRFLAR